ncbi:MAG TPA: hypothetical protein VGI10_05095 [Polyangiaceae bacterium]
MRTSDLHAWDWSHFDLKTWRPTKVYRPKTDGADPAEFPGDPSGNRTVVNIADLPHVQLRIVA